MKKFPLILLTMMAFAPVLHAADARIKNLQGDVSIRRAGQKEWKPAKKGQTIRRNDRVYLSTGSTAQLAFASGATLLVKEKSRFSLRRDPQGDVVSFTVGEFLIGLKRKLKGREQFRVRTPAAVAAVRGTVFWGKTDDAQTSYYACLTGAIEVSAYNKKVTVLPGQGTSIAYGKTPADASPLAVDPASLNAFAIDGSLQGLDEQIASEK